MKKFNTGKKITVTTLFYIAAIAGTLALVNACNKSKTSPVTNTAVTQQSSKTAIRVNTNKNEPLTTVVNVADVYQAADGKRTKVTFLQLEELFYVSDPDMLATFREAKNMNKSLEITYDPWAASILRVKYAAIQGAGKANDVLTGGQSFSVNSRTMSADVIDGMPGAAIINTATPGLTNVVPDMATAQLMFDFITHQACSSSGPIAIDQCISFQYCEDGCYARAHKMCWIINNKYHYDTHKIFSFALGGDDLCVQAQKWGGCCINWWYHVAPIVNVKTPQGVKSFVFDPAMFDQPVLLSVWLHAQENPACASGGNAHVTKINLQPTASYAPADGTGSTFYTDPTYSGTNSTMAGYSALISCP